MHRWRASREQRRHLSPRRAGIRSSAARVIGPPHRGAHAQAPQLRPDRRMVRPASAPVRGAVPVRATLPELLFGVALDLAIGDPRWLPHPAALFATLVDGSTDGVRLGNHVGTYPHGALES